MSLNPVLKALEPILESLRDGMLVSDRGRTIVLANDAAASLLGVTRAALVGSPIFDVALGLGDAASRALDGEPAPKTLRILAGARTAVNVSASPVRDGDGAVVGAVLTLAEADVAQGEGGDDGLRPLFDAMPQLGWAAKPDGAVDYYNRGWYEYTGASPGEPDPWEWEKVHDPALLPSVKANWARALAEGTPFEMAMTLRRHDGARRWFLTRAVPLRDARGTIVRWVGVSTDIQAQREARERLELLATLAGHLSDARTRAHVADVIVEHGMRTAAADTCTLYLLDDDDQALRLLAVRGVAPEIVTAIREIRANDGNDEVLTCARSGRALWVESHDEYVTHFPALALRPATGPRAEAFWAMPLVVEGHPIGLLAMGFRTARRFSDEERVFVDTFAKQCAQALLRALRLEREDKAQQALATTLRSIGDAVIATDVEGRVTFINPVAERLTGWPADEARGRPLDEVFRIFSETTGEPVESPVTKVLRLGGIVGLANHTVLVSRSGRRVPIDDSGAPIQDEAGATLGVVLVFRDVSEEKATAARRAFLADAGDALASSLDYRATLATVTRLAVPRLADWCAVDLLEPGASAPQQVAVAHADPAKIAYAREIGNRYPPDPDATTGVPEVIRSGRAELYTEIPQALLEAGARDDEHLRIIRELRLESAMVVPLRGRTRTLGAMTFIYADSGRRYTAGDLAFAEEFARRAAMAIENATSYREVEASRAREQELRNDAEVANRAKDEFLATVSHELRTPLNAILGWTVILRRRPLEPDLEQPLAVIERNARAQVRLIDDVLDVSRIISGKLALSLGRASLRDVVAGAVEAVTPAADAKGITVVVDDANAPLEITADAGRLQQIVWNLLANAVKFTPRGGSVGVELAREGSDVVVRVTDTGEGIPPSALSFVFEPFRQADASTTRRHGGLGLGLAIVKQLVAAHGGTVTAESAGVGRGATFTVRLPARVTAVSPAPGRVTPTPSPETFAALPARRIPRLEGLKVLVVDDEEDARSLIEEVLRLQGADVCAAASAEDAVLLFDKVRPDVLVSDIGMPGMDGYALVKRLRGLPAERGGRTPAIALTAYARGDDAQRAFAAGFQSHVAKPVDPAHLAVLVANLGGRIVAS